jgi:hypothetical protein
MKLKQMKNIYQNNIIFVAVGFWLGVAEMQPFFVYKNVNNFYLYLFLIIEIKYIFALLLIK